MPGPITTGGGGGVAALTPWASNIDADGNQLLDLGGIGVGVAALTATPTVTTMAEFSKALGTKTDGGTYVGVEVSPTATFTTTAGADFVALHAVPNITPTANMGEIVGLQFQPTISGAGTVDAIHGIESLCTIGAPCTLARGNWAQITCSLGTTALAVSFEAEGVRSGLGTFTKWVGFRATTSGTIGTAVGLDITNLAGGTTKWGMQVGDYQSYHQGKLSLGGTTAPTYGLDLLGTAQDRGVIRLAEAVATPTNPASSTGVLIYHKTDAIVFAFNDAGTMRYKSLTLSGTGVTWVASTTAP